MGRGLWVRHPFRILSSHPRSAYFDFVYLASAARDSPLDESGETPLMAPTEEQKVESQRRLEK
jgi:hypothetical protein